jgi:FtsZ-interacting cell division protein ZipA
MLIIGITIVVIILFSLWLNDNVRNFQDYTEKEIKRIDDRITSVYQLFQTSLSKEVKSHEIKPHEIFKTANKSVIEEYIKNFASEEIKKEVTTPPVENVISEEIILPVKKAKSKKYYYKKKKNDNSSNSQPKA